MVPELAGSGTVATPACIPFLPDEDAPFEQGSSSATVLSDSTSTPTVTKNRQLFGASTKTSRFLLLDFPSCRPRRSRLVSC